VSEAPGGGETILGSAFHMIPGGKGANQAVAASRLGGSVAMIGKVGGDSFGGILREGLVNDGVNDGCVWTEAQASTGVASITVEDSGENRIIVVPGANHCLADGDLLRAEALLAQAKVIVTQFEIPMPVVEHLIERASQTGAKLVVNAAPVQPLSDATLRKIDYLVVNEHEAASLSGVTVTGKESAFQAARTLVQRGAKNVVLTLGAEGALICSAGEETFVPSFVVHAVDTTASGDAFIGGFAVALLDPDLTLAERVRFANAAGALTATRLGAQSSLPTLAEVNTLLEANVNAA
jgi:ribokinase